MKRALTAGELAILRTHPQKVEYYLAVHKPKVIYRATIPTVPSDHPASSITTTTVVGQLANVRPGQTLKIGTLALQNDYGEVRIRGVAGNNILIAEAGCGLVNWKNGAHLTVMDDFRVWPIHHSYDVNASNWLVDLQTYTSQLSRYGPQVIMGPHDVLFLEDGKAVGSYVGNLSYSHTPGVSITSQRWDFPNGIAVTSALGSSAAPVLATYLNASPGGEYFSLSATDSNGASHIGRRLLFVFGSGNSAPQRCRFEQITGGLKAGGYKTRIYVNETANSNVFQDGAQVVIVERASYGTIASSVGGNYYARDSVVFAGRILSESQRIEPFTEEVSFSAETIDSEMRRTGAYDLFLESSSAPSSWDMAANLTLDRAAIALIKYRSTIANVTDFNLAGGIAATNEIPYRDLPAGTMFDQLAHNYQAAFGIVAADMQGTLWAQLDNQVTGLSANLPTAVNIGLADRRDQVNLERDHRDATAITRLYAIQGGTTLPLAAESPGGRQGYFGGRVEVSRNLTVPDQDTLITWAGNARARDNNRFGKVTVPLAGNYRYDSVPQSRFTMSLSPTDNLRAHNFANMTFLANESSIEFNDDGQFALGSVSLEAVVNGIGGSSLTYPTVGGTIDPPAFSDPTRPPDDWEDPPLVESAFIWEASVVLGEAMGLYIYNTFTGSNEIALPSYVYSVGWTHQGNNPSNRRVWRVEKRLTTTGELQWAQDIITTTGSASGASDTNQAMGVWADDTDVFVVGWERWDTNKTRCRIQKLSAVDGALGWSTTIGDGSTSSIGWCIKVDAGQIYVVANVLNVTTPGPVGSRVYARSRTDGSAVWTSPATTAAGVPVEIRGIDLGINSDTGEAITTVYAVGDYRDPTQTQPRWRIQTLIASTGAFDKVEQEDPSHPYGASFWNVYGAEVSHCVGTPGGSGGGTTYFFGFGIVGNSVLWQDNGQGTAYNGIPHGSGGNIGLFYLGWRDTNDNGFILAYNAVDGDREWITGLTNVYTNALGFSRIPDYRLFSCGRKNGDSFCTHSW